MRGEDGSRWIKRHRRYKDVPHISPRVPYETSHGHLGHFRGLVALSSYTAVFGIFGHRHTSMDDIVLRAMTKWPNVPAVFGWLSLDRRGRWLLRGERIGNRAANEFISRNYGHDEEQRWYFQNGPQRVFVTLSYTPWVLVLDADEQLRTHTELTVSTLTHCWIDDDMHMLLETEHGVGLVHDHDLSPLTDAFHDSNGTKLDDDETQARLESLAAGAPSTLSLCWGGHSVPVSFIAAGDVPCRFGFDPEPSAP